RQAQAEAELDLKECLSAAIASRIASNTIQTESFDVNVKQFSFESDEEIDQYSEALSNEYSNRSSDSDADSIPDSEDEDYMDMDDFNSKYLSEDQVRDKEFREDIVQWSLDFGVNLNAMKKPSAIPC
ncbi:hypothetical protein TSAR_006193, partial [Trichomalopsis sarcophagae]